MPTNTAPRTAAATFAAATVAGLLVGLPQVALAAWSPPVPREVVTVPVRPAPATARPTWTPAGKEVRGAPSVTWPAPDASRLARVGGVAATGSRVLDRDTTRRAGVDGILLTLSRPAGAVALKGEVEVSVDYRPFAKAFGADWATRLRLSTLPAECASQASACTAPVPLATRNDLKTGTVSATVLGGALSRLVAVSAAPAGPDGDYRATSLSPASTWQASEQTGDFSWSYPIPAPAVPGNLTPQLTLAYSSGSVDGRTAATNAQGSWVGDGWDLWPGYIERRYRSCNNDKDPVNGNAPNNAALTNAEQCWFSDNATMSLNGSSTELVRGDDGLWHGTSDNGARIERLTDSSLHNGDNDNEYWRVTTVDGTQYYFGRNRRPGWSTGKDETASVWTTPVYGNHPSDPCYSGSFEAARCDQAWRWNLDYVVDPHNDTMTYFYARETGAYGREIDPNKRTEYTRGGYLTRIDYGTRSDTEFTAPPAARVQFGVADRCTPNTTCTFASPSSWPDTPLDQFCAQTPCTSQLAPTYWTQKRLNTITTEIRDGQNYVPVDTITLRQEYLNAGDHDGSPMWLRGLTRTGQSGGAVSQPEILFDPGADPLPNRVDGPADGRPALNRWRMNTITTESGAQIVVTYSGPDCTRTSLPDPATNTKRCMPQFWAPEGLEPTMDWFHKYVVTRVDVWDATGASGHEQTNYDYLDNPAWHYDDGELTEPKFRSWAEWRGYSRVVVRRGLDPGPQSATEHLYFRGMDGDHLASGTRSVSITDSQGVSLPDHEALGGQLREETVLSGPGGSAISGTISDFWRRGPIATRGSLKAYMVNTSQTRSRVVRADGSTRWAKTVTTFNDDNLPTMVDDLGDEATDADDTCTRTTYARSPATWMLDRVSRTEKVGVRCATTPSRPADVVSDQRTYYDNATTFGAAPTRGDVVRTEELGTWPSYVTTARNEHDQYGRVTVATDARGYSTTTVYTPATGGPLTRQVERNPLGQTTTTDLMPQRQQPKSIVDSNGARTDFAYDGLGRLTDIWLPGRDRATKTANLRYEYHLRNDAPTYVVARTLLPSDTGYRTTVKLYDGQLRERQVQTQATGGGRRIADTVRNSRGLVAWTSRDYFTTDAPSGTLVTSTGQVQIPSITEKAYDGADRVVSEVFKANGVEQWRTTTAYDGERELVTPPAGGTATMTVRDARGNPVELRQYHGATPTGNFDATRYTYTDRGDLATVTDAAGNTWTYQYDQRGRRIRTDDPDRGRTTVTYDDAGNVTSTTDARGGTVATTYDELGRRTSVRDGSATGPARAEWAYDTAPGGVGRLASSVRHFGAKDYRTEITGYDAGGRALGTKLVVPAADGFGRTEFLTSSTYKVDGSPATTTLPALGDLAEEKLTFNYNDVGAPTTFLSALSIYAYSVTYDKLGGLTQRVLGNFGSRTAVTYTIDEPTNRLTEAVTTPETKPEAAHFKYTYDPIGNVTRVVDAPAGGATPDTQCYRYDLLRRLTTAWTPASGDCTANPSATALGGPAPYYRDWAYDSTGNRTSEVVHTPTGTTTRSYAQPAAGSRQPHAVQSTSAGDTFGYDPSGNMTSRARAGAAMQNLAWDAEGHLASVTDAAGATSYVYDADGNRLISRTPAGATLYLDDGSEVFAPAGGGAAVGTRYYKHLGVTVAVRKASGLTWIVGDQHQTAEVQISGPNQTVVRRRSLPFGESRGPVQAWVGTRGFVDQPVDGTGLDHLGAREYDPGLGRFISVDPVVNVSDPQTMHGYAYADNNAPSLSDADGRCYGREEGDLCPGQKLGPWAGTVEGDAARDRVFGPTRGKYNNLTGKKNTDGPAKEGEDQQAKWKEIASKIARVLGDAAAVLGFVPGWLCEACAIAGAIMGGIALVLFLVAGELGEALKVAGETVIGFFLGKAAAKTVEKTVIARYGETMLYQARHYAGNLRGQWVRVSRMVPASLRYKMDNIFAVLVGTDGVLAHVAIGGGFGPGHKEE